MESQKSPLVEVQVNWESSETYQIPNSTKLKDFLYGSVISLTNQLVEQDYTLKFNNNPVNKIYLNNQVKDLVNKFNGNRIDITLSVESENEIKSLILSSEEKERKFSEIKKIKDSYEEEKLSSLDYSKIEKKICKLVKPLNSENMYFQKVKEKIIKKFLIYDEMFKESEELKTNLIKLKISETLVMYNKIIDYCLADVFDFFYKFGLLFLNHKKYFRQLGDIYLKFFEIFFKELNADIKKSLNTNKSALEQEYNQLFLQLDKSIFEHRVLRHIGNEPPTTVFFAFEEPVQVNISELEYNEIKGLLAQFPTAEEFKKKHSDFSNENMLKEIFYMVFERDVRIYQNYGIKMEDFIYGALLYEN